MKKFEVMVAFAGLILPLAAAGDPAPPLDALRVDVLRQWHSSALSCLEALREYSQNDEPGAFNRLERGQSLAVRQVYDTAYADERSELWKQLLGASNSKSKRSPGNDSDLLGRQFRSDPRSIYNAARLIGEGEDSTDIGIVKKAVVDMRQALMTYIDLTKSPLSPAALAQAKIDLDRDAQRPIDSIRSTVSKRKRAKLSLTHANTFAENVRTFLSLPYPANSDLFLQSVGVADLTIRALEADYSGEGSPMDAAVLYELLYPQRFNAKTLDSYRALYQGSRTAFFHTILCFAGADPTTC